MGKSDMRSTVNREVADVARRPNAPLSNPAGNTYDDEQDFSRQYIAALEELNEVTTAIRDGLSSGTDVLQRLADAARHLLNMPMASVVLLTEDRKHIEVVHAVGYEPPLPKRMWALSETAGCRACIESGQVVAQDDLERDAGPFNMDVMRPLSLRAAMLIPLKVEGTVIGVLALVSRTPRTIAEYEIRLANLLGTQATVIIGNNRMYARMEAAKKTAERQARERRLLWDISTALQQSKTVEAALQQLVDLVPAALDVDMCAVALPGTEPGTIRAATATSGTVAATTMAPNTVIRCDRCEGVMRTCRIAIVEDTQNDPQFAREYFPGIGSAFYVPLPDTAGRAQGLLALMRKRTGAFTAEQVQMAELLARAAGSMLENIRLDNETRVALEEQKKLLHQREVLYVLNTSIYQARDLTQALQRICDTAPGVLGVDFCSVALTTESPDMLELAAATHPNEIEVRGLQISIAGDRTKNVFTSRKIEVIVDASREAGVHPDWRRIPAVGSIAYVPLFRSDGQPLGIFSIVRSVAGGFTTEQLNLSEVFATRAATAIETARLQEQTRRDAETKTLLLRELNHRVKNNLSGIVTLLTMDEPANMPESVRRWMGRAVARVRTIARTHDLFSGGIQRIPLVALIRETLLASTALKPAGVKIHQELDGINVTLRTDRAVTVAMILHELCFNALMHGVPHRGNVWIRLRRAAGDAPAIVLSVADDGRGTGAIESSRLRDDRSDEVGEGNGAPGQGLSLVGGLVGRELKGQFQLRRATQGGTEATVEFPLLAEECKSLEVADERRVYS